MRFGSLFSGIGGLDIGLERAGMECAWQVEIDEYANKVLAKHWPDVPRYRDVRECGAHNLEPVDLICGGFPCQDVSLAGARAGLDGKRSTLWSEFARLIREIRPRWVLAENVPGLLSSDNGRFFGNILRDLADRGYDAEWDCIPASAFGAPHRRGRLFIVAHPQRHPFVDGVLQERCGTLFQGGKESVWGNYWNKSQVASGPVAILEGWGKGWAMGQSPLVRMDDGVSEIVDRLRCLGNAVVPQCAEWIGRRIMAMGA